MKTNPRIASIASILPIMLLATGRGPIGLGLPNFGPPRVRGFDTPRRGDRTPVPRNDAAHIAAAEAKRERKAARKNRKP